MNSRTQQGVRVTTRGRRRMLPLIGVLAAASLSLAACAQGGGGTSESTDSAADDFPSKPITLVVPYAPGGSSDALTRAFASCLSEEVDEEVLVENRAGANGVVGGQYVMNQDPDGHTLVLLAKSLFAVTPLFLEDANPLSLDEMTLVTGAVREPAVLVANSNGPYQTLDDVLAADNAGAPVTFGTSGLGSTTSFALTLFFESAGIPATEVPFEGGGPARTALLGAQVDFSGAHPSEVAEQVEAGTLNVLAVFADERSPVLPDVPTAKESGVDVVIDRTAFFAGPPGIPEGVTEELASLSATALEKPQCETFMEENLMEPWIVDGAEIKDELESDKARFEQLIADLGIDVTGGS